MRPVARLLLAFVLASAGGANAATLQLLPGQTARLEGQTLTLLRVQDSRCPADVQCVRAGELAASVLVWKGHTVRLLRLTFPAPATADAADGWFISAVTERGRVGERPVTRVTLTSRP